MYGRAGVQFYTQPKTVTAKWPADDVTAITESGGGSGSSSKPSGCGPKERLPGLDRVGAA